MFTEFKTKSTSQPYFDYYSMMVAEAKSTLVWFNKPGNSLSDKVRKSIKKRMDYEDYLKSSKWRKLRKRVLVRDKGLCQLCKSKATQVHHKHYKNIFNEKLKDLMSICKSCHKKIHGRWSKRNKVLK